MSAIKATVKTRVHRNWGERFDIRRERRAWWRYIRPFGPVTKEQRKWARPTSIRRFFSDTIIDYVEVEIA